MMLRYAFALEDEARAIENAVDRVLSAGWRTADLAGGSDATPLSCDSMTEKIIENL